MTNLLSGVEAIAVRGDEEHRRHPAVAVSYGSGLALIADEFALTPAEKIRTREAE